MRGRLRRMEISFPIAQSVDAMSAKDVLRWAGLKLGGGHQVAESAEAPHRLDWERRVAEGGRRKEVTGTCASARHWQEKLAWKKFKARLATMKKL